MYKKGVSLPNHDQMTPYYNRVLVNIGSGNGLFPGGTKPLPEPMLTYHP